MTDNEHNEQFNFISKGTSIKGDVVSDGDMKVDGSIEGNLIVKGKLYMGHTGKIKGTLESRNAELAGRVEGNINVAGLLALLKTSDIQGDLLIGQLSIEPGAKFSGHCTMKDEIDRQNSVKPEEQYAAQ